LFSSEKVFGVAKMARVGSEFKFYNIEVNFKNGNLEEKKT